MWTRCVCILYLLLMCRAHLEDYEKAFYEIINNTTPTTPIANITTTPIRIVKTTNAHLEDYEKAFYEIINNTTPTTPIANITTTPIRIIKTTNGKSCAIDVSRQGVCKKRSECDLDAPKIDPASLVVPRASNGNNNMFQCEWLEICCPIEKVTNKAHVVKKSSIPLGCGYSDLDTHVFVEKKNVYDYAEFGEFPWMIALLQKRSNGQTSNYEYIGGGALIHPSVVITVAHKFNNITNKLDEIKCRAGEWDTMSEDELRIHQDRDVSDIIIHPEFLDHFLYNDVALLILKSPFDLNNTPHIAVACLEPKLPSPGTVCYTMGWGTDFIKGTKYANILKKIELQLVSAETCENQFRNTRLGQGYTLHRSLTCAGGKAGLDTCIGDGGSPLICSIPGGGNTRYSVVGLVAYGAVEECGLDNLPGAYVKVPEIYKWVIDEINHKGFNSSIFVY